VTRSELLRLRADLGEDATLVAGGTFLGVLMNNGILAPSAMISLAHVEGLEGVHRDGDALRIGAMVTHRRMENDPLVRELCPMIAKTFSLVANPRVRNWATIGGVLADADYASDPPSALVALGASVVLESVSGQRTVSVDELIEDVYQTVIEPDEVLTEVIVPIPYQAACYRKFRTRSHEDRPCVAVAAVRAAGELRVAVGAVAGRPQMFPEICSIARGGEIHAGAAREIGLAYSEKIEPIADARGSAEYRRRVIAVEVRRAIEELAA
jgi:carbon-monoxide dehydrogenase medium subunit